MWESIGSNWLLLTGSDGNKVRVNVESIEGYYSNSEHNGKTLTRIKTNHHEFLVRDSVESLDKALFGDKK